MAVDRNKMLTKQELEHILSRDLKAYGAWSSVYLARKIKLVQSLFTNYRYSRILDVGSSCGLGHYPELALENLASFSAYYVHLDLNRLSLLKAKRAHPFSTYLIADASTLPLRSEFFDCVFASDILEHVPTSEDAVNEWARVLEWKGHLIVFTPNGLTWPDRLRKALHQRIGPASTVDFGHVSVYQVEKLCQLLRQKFFNVAKLRGFNLVLANPIRTLIGLFGNCLDRINKKASKKFYELTYDLGKSYPRLCQSIFILAQ